MKWFLMERPSIRLFVMLLGLVNYANSQSTLSLLNTNITWNYGGIGSTQINFTLTSNLGNNVSPSEAWLGLGFNNASKMVRILSILFFFKGLIKKLFWSFKDGAGVVACIYSSGLGAVNLYQNTGYNSNLVSAANPTLGISSSAISIADGSFACSFTLDLSFAGVSYSDLAVLPQLYLLVAY